MSACPTPSFANPFHKISRTTTQLNHLFLYLLKSRRNCQNFEGERRLPDGSKTRTNGPQRAGTRLSKRPICPQVLLRIDSRCAGDFPPFLSQLERKFYASAIEGGQYVIIICGATRFRAGGQAGRGGAAVLWRLRAAAAAFCGAPLDIC